MIPILARSRGADLCRQERLNFGEMRNVEALRRAERIPCDIGQGMAVADTDQAKHFATDLVLRIARAQLVSDMVANQDFVNQTIGFRHGGSFA